MIKISMDDIKKDVAGYLQRAKEGETLLVLEENKPIVEIKPITLKEENLRPYGLCAGEFLVPDDFDAPLPDEIIKQFEG